MAARRHRGSGGGRHDEHPPRRRVDALEHPDDGRAHGDRQGLRRSHLEGPRPEALELDTFKVSSDPDFEAKLVDVVGLYMHPPERAVVFSFDEKTQCQALDRTQPSLPMKRGRARTMTHDYKRHGTTDLFAAMNVATGEVLYDTKPRHSARDLLSFFNFIDLNVPSGLEIHVVLDNLSAHKSAPVKWLARPEAGAVAPALHTDQLVVAEPRRGLVLGAHRDG